MPDRGLARAGLCGFSKGGGAVMLIRRLPGKGETYRTARGRLWEAEVALVDPIERVAEMRRGLPLETEVEDYSFLARSLPAGFRTSAVLPRGAVGRASRSSRPSGAC